MGEGNFLRLIAEERRVRKSYVRRNSLSTKMHGNYSSVAKPCTFDGEVGQSLNLRPRNKKRMKPSVF